VLPHLPLLERSRALQKAIGEVADWERAQELGPSDALSQSDFDAAQSAHQIAEANVAVGKAAILQAQNGVAQAEAALRRAEQNLGYCTIISPVKGLIIDRRVNIGQTVVASLNAPSLFLLAKDFKRMQVWVSVNEADIGSIHQGQPVTFTVDTYPETDFEGTVTSIYPDAVIENTVVNYITIISIGDRQGKTLRPEMTANVTLFLETRENVLTVPRKAIRRDRGRYVVMVVHGGTLEEREVRVGWRDDNYTEIVKGLEEGETVAIGTS